jgi:phage tail tape-measure protein
MRSLVLGIVLVTAVQVVRVGAQSQPAAEPAAAAPGAITVTGCLQANPAASGSSSPSGAAASGNAASSTPYVLANTSTNLARSEAAGAAPAGVTGAASGNTPGAVGTSGAVEVTSFVLHGRLDELGKHLGHRIEITGTASKAAPSGDSVGAATTAPASQPQQQVIPHEPHRGPVETVASPPPSAGTAHPSVQHLVVQSVRMLAETCK